MKKYIAPVLIALSFAVPASALADLTAPQDYAAPDEVQAPGVGAAAPLSNSAPATPTQTGGNTGSSPTQSGGNTGSSPVQSGGNTSSHVSSISNPLSSKFNSVGAIIQGFLDIFTYLVVIMAALALVWVGFQFILAQGNPDRLTELKRWLLYIVIGIAIVVGARVIINVVINTLEASGTVNQSVIQSAKKAANGQ